MEHNIGAWFVFTWDIFNYFLTGDQICKEKFFCALFQIDMYKIVQFWGGGGGLQIMTTIFMTMP